MADRGNAARIGRKQGSRSRKGEQRTDTLAGRVVLWISIQAIFVVLALLITAALQSTSAGG